VWIGVAVCVGELTWAMALQINYEEFVKMMMAK